jgi:hypothetical protein
MATREKTLMFGFDMITTVVTDATTTNFTQITVSIPEASPTFTSVFVEVGFQDVITLTGGTIGEHRCGLRLGASAYTTITELDDLTNTAENISGVIGPLDFTSHFTTNWTGTSMTCDIQVYFDQTTGTTLGMRNVTAILYVTYTYDDSTTTNPTQIKTVRIPLESPSGFLTATANTNINTYPALTGAGGLLCEASPNIKSYFFLLESNEAGQNNTADYTISTNIDSGTAYVFGAQERSLASERFCRWIWLPSTIPSTTSSHTFQMWSSVVNRGAHTVIDLIVTYEFDASTTSKVLNSILIPMDLDTPLGGTTPANGSRHQSNFYLVEPGTLALKQSAFRINWNASQSTTGLSFRAGSQSLRSYTTTGSNTICGMFCLQQRIDSGSVQGAAFTIARGLNTLNVDGFSSDATNLLTNVAGYITLNYESDLSTSGIGAHNHTVLKIMLAWDAALTGNTRLTDFAFSIPESNYYINGLAILQYLWTSSASQAIGVDVECLSSETQGAGYYEFFIDAYIGDGELACSLMIFSGHDLVKRFPQSIERNRIDIEQARDYRFYYTTAVSDGSVMIISYHSITFSVSGNISGSNGVDNIDLQLIRASDDVVIQEQTVSQSASSYTFTVYDNTASYYVSAQQDAAHLGITPRGLAS